MHYLKHIIMVIFTPIYWFGEHYNNRGWDDLLNTLMDEDTKVILCSSKLICTMGDREVWIGNYPYTFGYLYLGVGTSLSPQTMPSLPTRKRLRKYILAETGYDVKDRA